MRAVLPLAYKMLLAVLTTENIDLFVNHTIKFTIQPIFIIYIHYICKYNSEPKQVSD